MKPGVRMNEGSVANTCEAAGLKAVCAGRGCTWRSSRCLDTPLSVNGWACGCSYLNPISKIICHGKNAVNCPKMNRVFASISKWYGNGWGVVDGKYCEMGSKYTSSTNFQLFAYCVLHC